MKQKTKLKVGIAAVIIIAATMAGLMAFSWHHGSTEQKVTVSAADEPVKVETGRNITAYSDTDPAGKARTNEEVLGKVTGEDDEFTLTVDPENFDVTILGYDDTAEELASPEYELHKQLKSWMDENEFWDMTEVVYTQKYLRDEANGLTTLYFKIIRYPDSPLLATWSGTTAQYDFEIEWN